MVQTIRYNLRNEGGSIMDWWVWVLIAVGVAVLGYIKIKVWKILLEKGKAKAKRFVDEA